MECKVPGKMNFYCDFWHCFEKLSNFFLIFQYVINLVKFDFFIYKDCHFPLWNEAIQSSAHESLI